MTSCSPDWVRDGLAQFRAELALFLRTLWSFARHPRLFTRGWRAGEIRALNPFGYLLTAIGVVAVAQVLASTLRPQSTEDGSLWIQLARSVLPPLYFLALGLTTHLVLWLLGSRSARVRDTAAVALYASGPAYIGDAVVLLLVSPFDARPGPSVQAVAALLVVGCLLSFAFSFVAALREIHDVRRWPWTRAIVAFVVVFAASGFFFGGAEPPGKYGLHPIVWPPTAKHHHHWVAYFGD